MKRGQHLVQHAAMLRGHAGLDGKLGDTLPHVQQHRTELDSFRARAENEEYAGVGHHTK